jgi:Asp-tRNA(Asn)/Glu-tRNA(Gln) amidotransferase A subunit family amidase
MTAVEMVALTRTGKVSAVELHAVARERIERYDSMVKAWAHLNFEATHLEALRQDAEGMASGSEGRLRGVPAGVKDIFNTAQFPTEMGSLIWKGFTPGNDARVVAEMKYDGALVMGKTSSSEFAVHEPTETCNPWDLTRAPGTSSGGSAAAVAAGMVPVALGSQTAGSIIRPASYCGVAGFKPTFGLVPRTGVLKTTDTLDTVGWFARSVDDIELLFEVLRVKGLDYPLVDEKVKRRELNRGMRIGVFKGPNWVHATDEARAALTAGVDKIASAGLFDIMELDLPEFEAIYDAHEIIYCKALSYYFKSEIRNNRMQISGVLSGMLQRGDVITPEEYHREVEIQAKLTHELNERMPCDVWVTLSASGEAPVGLKSPDRPDSCKVWTYLGMPALSLPVLQAGTMPLGLQVVGRKYHDYEVLDVARQIWNVLTGGEAAAPVAPAFR